MKTIIDRVHEIVKKENIETDCMEKLIWAAYMLGREEATIETANQYRKILKEQIQRALSVRYHRMAMNVQGHIPFLKHDEFNREISKRFRKERTGF